MRPWRDRPRYREGETRREPVSSCSRSAQDQPMRVSSRASEQEHRYHFGYSVPRRGPATSQRDISVREANSPRCRANESVDIGSSISSTTATRPPAATSDSATRLRRQRRRQPTPDRTAAHRQAERASGAEGSITVRRRVDMAGTDRRSYVDGQDDDTDACGRGPSQGLPLVGMRPPDRMPAQASFVPAVSASTVGESALQLSSSLKRILGRHSVRSDFTSVRGPLR